MLILIAKTKNKPPKNIISIPSRAKVKPYLIQRNVKRLANGGRVTILYKKNGAILFIRN